VTGSASGPAAGPDMPGTAPGTAPVSEMRRLTDDEAGRIGTDIQRRIGVKTSRRDPLARFTTMRVGGPADLFAEVHNLFELRGLVRFARTRDIPLFILGRGSDLVISDAGIGGLVIHSRAQGARIEGTSLIADAGLPMARAATLAKDAGLSGLEFGLAIPGTVGGAVWANAGAHESDVAAVLTSASVMLGDGTEAAMTPAELELRYRDSRLKHSEPGRPEVVTSATFHLTPAEPAAIAAALEVIRHWRQSHQPLGMPSAGSVFRNPSPELSAGALIDGLGLKGRRIGGASVSEKHANFIVNDQKGSAADVRRLTETVRSIVLRERGIELVPEIVFAGDWSGWEPAG
jgi:UDP-N-acetylmuramate dehydrogenase